jgi:hypothetical protein
MRTTSSTALASLLALSTAAGAQPPPAPPACPFSAWTTYEGLALRRTGDTNAYFYATSHQRVDADGAPNAYHPSDVNGTACPATGRGLDCPANAGYRSNSGTGNATWWRSVLVPDLNNNALAFRQTQGEHRGFFVSQTSLRNVSFAGVRDPRSYVDAATVPYVVMPSTFHDMRGTGTMGDIGFALHLGNGRTTAFVFGDTKGSAARLGEASIAFWRALGGTNPNPRNGTGMPEGRVAYVAFPRSRLTANLGWPIDLERLRTEAAAKLEQIGGVEMLRRCAG